jgi:serine/threonine protein kinase
MAPEMIQNKAHNHTLDIWSLGILLYELVHGRAPFTGVHPREISDKIMRGVIRFKPGVSNEYKDLVNSILKYETTERLPLIKVFDHPWVKNFEKKYNLNKVVPPPKKPDNTAELEKKKAETKALAEAAEKQRLLEAEAAAKEAERQEKIKK